jgi:molybdate transport system regulatory protein
MDNSIGSLLSIRLRFSDDARLGPGKIALLEAIERTGSVAAAGQLLGMSERRASLLIESLTAFFGEPVVLIDQNTGEARISALGSELVRAFRAVEADARRSLDTQFAAVRAKMSAHRDQTD